MGYHISRCIWQGSVGQNDPKDLPDPNKRTLFHHEGHEAHEEKKKDPSAPMVRANVS